MQQEVTPCARAEYGFKIRCAKGFSMAIAKEIPTLLRTYDIQEGVTVIASAITGDQVLCRILARNDPGYPDESLFDLVKAIILTNYDATLEHEARHV